MSIGQRKLSHRLWLGAVAVGLLVAIGSAGAWWRSYVAADEVEYHAIDGRGVVTRSLRIRSDIGGVVVDHDRVVTAAGATPPAQYRVTTQTAGWKWEAEPVWLLDDALPVLGHFDFFWMDNPYFAKGSGIRHNRLSIEFPWWTPMLLGLGPTVALALRILRRRRRDGGRGFPLSSRERT